MIDRIFTYMADDFGGKRGFLHFQICRLLQYLGFYRHYKKIDATRVHRLVFVCMGNICRSSLGEAVAKAEGVDSVSFGLDTRGGAEADPRAIAFANELGLDMSAHRTSRFADMSLLPTDLLVAVEPGHAQQLRRLVGDGPQITLLALWHTTPHIYIHDPYSANEQYFHKCETAVTNAAKNLANHVKFAQKV